MVKKYRVHHLAAAKESGEKITMLTAYDQVAAAIFDRAGIDTLLVGDSIGNTMLGYESTIPVTLEHIITATRAVTGAAKRALVVADLPFGTYEAGPQQALASAVRLFKEGGAHAVKLEGGRRVSTQVKLLVDSGIPVFGHLGFTPQSEHALGGKRIQGRGQSQVEALRADALALQDAGACAVVLEMVPGEVAAELTRLLEIPTIGIGAGSECSGQVLVWTDMAGMGDWSPSFSHQFGQVGKALEEAAAAFAAAVRETSFPGPEHTFKR